MAKRGYKLQELVAHSASVNCLKIGKKACRLFVTGGDDHKVNLWAIGKPTSLMSLCGHTSPVESVVFDAAETLVLAGASAGAIKLWDLEETKMVRTLTGHRSNCTAVEFHPFGEFFASGSLDTNLKIWDIRKKGCIHTYKGHTEGIGAIRFTPDGRWVVSGGSDNVVKVWDLTAGKLLHDFKFHEGRIHSIDFHPLEFLLATGSADKTVKFWDLETFELIGSSRAEFTGVRSITFHPDGRTLFCGLDDGLKVYSWEPVICQDVIDMGWSTLGDLCIYDGKLLGCSYYRNSVGVWVADVTFHDPYGASLVPEQTSSIQHKLNLNNRKTSENVEHDFKCNGLRCPSPEPETIKTIYVDPAGEKPIGLRRVGSHNSTKVVPSSDSKEMASHPTHRRSPTVGTPAKSSGRAVNRSFVVPNVVPRESSYGKTSTNSRRESITSGRTENGAAHKSAHVRSPSNSKSDGERLLPVAETGNKTSSADSTMDLKIQARLVKEDEVKESLKEKHLNSKCAAEKLEKSMITETTSLENCNQPHASSKRITPCKFVDGGLPPKSNFVVFPNATVAVVPGRTRSLVEKFERGERVSADNQATLRTSAMLVEQPQISEREAPSSNDNITEDLLQLHDEFLSTLRSRLTKLQVMRQYWERNDIKGAINAMRKLPDQSVQADVISVLMEKMEISTLDLFSCLLPVLTRLLDSKMERHVNVSLEMLIKLVAVFGPVVHSTISAPKAVGVDLHAEQRLECCKQCFVELQKVQKIIPDLIKRGGVLAKCAYELNLLLLQT